MKPRFFTQRLWIPHFVVVCATLLSGWAFASDRFHIPPPPPPPSPQQVVKDIGSFFHRLGTGIKDVSKKTWSAVREKFVEEDEPMPPRHAPRSRPVAPPGDEEESFARAKAAVPYRFDDADAAEARRNAQAADAEREMAPKPTMIPRRSVDEEKSTEPLPRKSFANPNEDVAGASQPESLPQRSAATKPAPSSAVEFGRRVPGKPGVVYPPGVKEAPENMVDVGGFQSGQLVRDPRTGKLFRVP